MLPKSEKKIMQIIWKKKNVFLKDILNSYDDPKPAKTTIATLLTRMQSKGFIGYKNIGNLREYYALVSRKDFYSSTLNDFIVADFNASRTEFIDFLLRSLPFKDAELESIKKNIKQQLKTKKKPE